MSIFKNKHMMVATLMAPLLGLGTYLAVDMFVSEKPKVAEPGQNYLLVEKPNCRRSTGRCGLKNAEFELELSFDRLAGNSLLLKLRSAHPLDGVLLGQMVNEDDETPPIPMRPASPDGLYWDIEFTNPDPANQRLRLVASANESLYMGDVALKFTMGETDK